MSIYKSEKGRQEIISLYDEQLKRLAVPYSDKYVNTSFGVTHLIETGKPEGVPLLVFHGGNATTAYNLLCCDFLINDFHIYAADIIGHPGKSAEVSLSPRNSDYGKWAGEVIEALGYDSMCCFGGSFGAGIIAKTMCAAPEKVKRAVLYVPSGIKNAPAIRSMSMMGPMILYWITHKEIWLKKCMMPMAVTEDNITRDIFETAKLSIDHVKIKTGMPGNVPAGDIKKCKAPTLVMAAEKDCLFPAKGVLRRAERIISDCTVYLLEDRGHMSFLTDREKSMISGFLKGGKHVAVVPYDEQWEKDFADIEAEIKDALGELALDIEHVGSTSVRGLSAKPVIDIDVVIKDYSVFDAVVSALGKAGYRHEGDLGVAGREAFRYDGKSHLRKHHLYVCPQDSAELKRHIVFRDYLRSHPDAAEEYGRIKEEGASLYPYDIDKYIGHKAPFIEKVYREIGI